MEARRFRTGPFVVAWVAVLGTGCVMPAPAAGTAIATLEFSRSDRATGISASSLDETYRLELACSGPDDVTVRVLVDSAIAVETTMPCAPDATLEVDIAAKTGHVSLAVDGDGEGRLELFGPV